MELSLELFSQDLYGLTFDFKVNPLSCGNNEHYEQYIRFSALSDASQRYSTTHVLVGSEDGRRRILGFVTLRASSYIKRSGDVSHGESALEVMELAVDQRYERRGFGSLLMDYAVSLADDINSYYMAIKYIVVCADRQALPFYSEYGFSQVSDYGEIPHNGANDDCIPMFLQLNSEPLSP